MGWATKHIETLKAGGIVKCRPKGNSMVPLINSGDLVIIQPFAEGEHPIKGMIVLAKVKGKQFLHLVTAVKSDQYQISNNKGHVNGWTGRVQIFGRVTAVSK